MNLEKFKVTEAGVVSLRDWCSFVTSHPEQFSEQDLDEAFFTGRWMWSSHVLYETQMIPPTMAESIVGYLGSSYQVRKCPLASASEMWLKVYADDSRLDLEFQVCDFMSIEDAIEAAHVMYHEALQGSAVQSMAMAA